MAPPRRHGATARTREAWATAPTGQQKPVELGGLLQRVQAYVFQRRLRVKDNFRDFDPLRCGRCTTEQFVRALNQLVPSLRQTDVDALVDHFTDLGPHVVKPQVVSYQQFARQVDEVFVVPELEKSPRLKVPSPGFLVRTFRPRPPPPSQEEAKLNRLLHRLALLTQTRGVIFKTCFQDSERSNAASVLCPRHAGKVTKTQFLQSFPFMEDVSDAELALLLSRYSTETGDVHYMALHRDMEVLLGEEPSDPRHLDNSWVSKSLLSARRTQTQEPVISGEEVVAKIKGLVASRRLPFHGLFGEFDRLRRGTCRPEQVGSVLALLKIELTSKEFESLLAFFADSTGAFRYRDFITIVTDVPRPEL